MLQKATVWVFTVRLTKVCFMLLSLLLGTAVMDSITLQTSTNGEEKTPPKVLRSKRNEAATELRTSASD